MCDDYRNTKYCPSFKNLQSEKDKVKDLVLKTHPQVQDLYPYLSSNKLCFKKHFLKAYNGKCAYCGVSVDIIPLKMFEIDHFIPKEADCFESKAHAGCMENLVISCFDCNRSKGDFEISNDSIDKVFPDGEEIVKTFIRDDKYYIRVSKEKENDDITAFYFKLKLNRQIHRIDYLLMNMKGLRAKLTDKHPSYAGLTKAIEFLQSKRNIASN